MFSLFLVQGANYLAPLLVLPYLSRVLGLDGFGTIAIVLSACAVALIFTDFGFNLSATYWIAKNINNRKEISYHIGAIFIIKSIICLFLVLGVIIFNLFFTDLTYLSFSILVCLVIIAQSFQSIWFFQGIEKMKNVTLLTVIAKLSYMALVFIFVSTHSDVNIVLICLTVSNLISSFVSVFLIYKEGYEIKLPNTPYIWSVFKGSTPFFLSRAAVGLYTSASAFIVGSIGGVQQAALYSSAEKLYQAGQGLTSPITQALFPYISRSGDIKILYRLVSFLLVPISIVFTFAYFYSEQILVLFYGPDFSNSSDILRLFLICLVVTFISVNFGYPAFSSIGRVDIANKTVMFAALIQMLIISILIFMNKVSAYNIAMSVLFVESVVMLIRVFVFFKMKHKSSI
ncbi:oligosaccharide flippase family protein [Vibrio mimicus]